MRYLGIWISQDIQELWTTNFGWVIEWPENRIPVWSKLPISTASRIAIAKMIIIPKFLYLFQNIPLPLTGTFLRRLRSNLISLVWAGRQPRISWEILTLPLEQGGLGAPDMTLYALCAQVQFLHFWIHLTPFQPHVAIEKDRSTPLPLTTALYAPYKSPRGEINTV